MKKTPGISTGQTVFELSYSSVVFMGDYPMNLWLRLNTGLEGYTCRTFHSKKVSHTLRAEVEHQDESGRSA